MNSSPPTEKADSGVQTRHVPLFSLGRVLTITSGTVTQLFRMKVFYFLFAFALVMVAAGNFSLPATPAQELSTIKKVSFGTMDLFAWLFSIVATALLIPRDQEDRTLYTILAKPVRRIEYLLGKLGGVLCVVGLSLLVMGTICAITVGFRESLLVSEEIGAMQADGHFAPDEVNQQIDLIRHQGLRPELALVVLAYFFKAAVVAAVTLLLSTIASSSLFTIIVSILVFLIGNAHALATGFWLQESGNSWVVRIVVKVVKVLIPDFQIFAFSEGIVQGEVVPYWLVGEMGLITVGYLLVFLLLSLLVFVDKEF